MKAIFLNNQARAMNLFWKVLIGVFLKNGYELTCLVPYGDAQSEKDLKEIGASVRNYSLNRKGLNPFQDMRTYRELKNIFMQEKPDLLFSSTIKAVIYGSLAAKNANVSKIYAAITGLGYVFERDNFFKKMINLAGQQLYRLALQNISGIFFQNKDDLELFQKKGLIKNIPVFMAPGTGVDLRKFCVTSFPEGKEINFLLIARLLEAKGLREYVNAAKILKKKWPDANFQLLGPQERGPGSISSAELDGWIKAGEIEYLGETRDVRPFIANAHVAVLPSWREGVPTAIMEAMAMGRPCVVANSPGCREVLKKGENGFFCEAHNPESLAEAMQNFLEKPKIISVMGKAARQMVEKYFDADKVANDMFQAMTSSGHAELG